MKEKIYQTLGGKYKTIFFSEKELIFSEEEIVTSVQFTQLYKYPRLVDKTVTVRFNEIQNLIIDENSIKIKSSRLNKTFKLSETDKTSFENQIQSLSFKKTLLKKTKVQRIMNHHGIFTTLSGLFIAFYISNGGDFSSINGRGRNRLAGEIMQTILDTIGAASCIIISILISIYGIYSIWNILKQKSNANLLSYSNIQRK